MTWFNWETTMTVKIGNPVFATYFDFQFPITIATFFKLCACLKKMEAILESFKVSILKRNVFNLIHQLLKHRASY